MGGYTLWKKYQKKRCDDEKYKIISIIQTGPEKEALKTAYLAELLGLSVDQPTKLYAFDVKKGEQNLLSSPVIAKAKVKRMPPDAIYVDYEVRKPIAWVADFKNIAVDRDGYLFPVTPFFSPKELPEIYLGLDAFPNSEQGWHLEKNPRVDLVYEILEFLDAAPWLEGIRIKRIDVSNAFAPSLGQREVVLCTEEEISFKEISVIFPKILRLTPKDYVTQLNNFFALKRVMMDDYRRQISSIKSSGRFATRIIDLRIPQLAFVEKS